MRVHVGEKDEVPLVLAAVPCVAEVLEVVIELE